MGTWGPSISSNDLYADVYGQFIDRYNEGGAPNNISRELLSEYESELAAMATDSHDFWFALAKAQWDTKSLDPDVLARVAEIVESGANLDRWKELDASPADIRKRSANLTKFLAKLRSERKTLKKRNQRKFVEPMFAKGDCVAFRFRDGLYGGALVLEADREEGLGLNLFLCTRIRQEKEPTQRDFLKAIALIEKQTMVEFEDGEMVSRMVERPAMCWLPRWDGKRDLKYTYKTVANINVEIDYLSAKHSFSYAGHPDIHLVERIAYQFEHEGREARPALAHDISRYIRKPRWWHPFGA